MASEIFASGEFPVSLFHPAVLRTLLDGEFSGKTEDLRRLLVGKTCFYTLSQCHPPFFISNIFTCWRSVSRDSGRTTELPWEKAHLSGSSCKDVTSINCGVNSDYLYPVQAKVKQECRECAKEEIFLSFFELNSASKANSLALYPDSPIEGNMSEVQNSSLHGRYLCNHQGQPADHKQPVGSKFLLCWCIVTSTLVPSDGSSNNVGLPGHCRGG